MISYPGDILRRFGRYEAVEDLGASGAAHLWGAWDPYLDRFVVIVELSAVDPAQLFAGMRAAETALERWTANKVGSDELILDFSPGSDDASAFIVILAAEEGFADPEATEDGNIS